MAPAVVDRTVTLMPDILLPEIKPSTKNRHVWTAPILLSGDNASARGGCRSGWHPPPFAGRLRQGKAAAGRQLEAAGQRVPLVGDGINETPSWPPRIRRRVLRWLARSRAARTGLRGRGHGRQTCENERSPGRRRGSCSFSSAASPAGARPRLRGARTASGMAAPSARRADGNQTSVGTRGHYGRPSRTSGLPLTGGS